MSKAKNTVATALASSLLASMIALAATWADASQGTPVVTQIVDALNTRYGIHPGYRANHAKGIVAEGTFKASPEASQLSKSPLFTGAVLPVTVRFSDAGGRPDVHDGVP